jgi:putative copper resistance protein D
MYTSLGLPWVTSLLGDQHAAGLLALIIGEASLLIAIVALLTRWSSLDDRSDDAGLLDYQPMLDRLNR